MKDLESHTGMLLEHYSRRQNPSSGKSTQGINEQADITKIGNYRDCRDWSQIGIQDIPQEVYR